MFEALRIDEEFKNVLPPLTDEQFGQLEENILREGILNPIITWNGIIVDGHNRYAIVQKHPEISFTTKEMEFENRYAVIDWIITHQKGQRNLTEAQWTNMIGLLLEVRKLAHGGDHGNQYTKVPMCKNCTLPNNGERKHSGRTSEEIGKEFGIAARTVDDAYAFHRGIETIKEEDSAVADDILAGKISVPKQVVQKIRKADKNTVKETVKAIKDGTIKRQKKSKEQTQKEQELIANISNDIATSRTSTVYVPTIDDLVNEIKANIEPYIEMMNRTIDGYADVIRGKSEVLISAIDTNIIAKFNEMKEKIKNVYA